MGSEGLTGDCRISTATARLTRSSATCPCDTAQRSSDENRAGEGDDENRAGIGRAGQGRAGQSRAGQDRIG